MAAIKEHKAPTGRDAFEPVFKISQICNGFKDRMISLEIHQQANPSKKREVLMTRALAHFKRGLFLVTDPKTASL